ncbi:hypothetical protein G9F72_023905 [Clostridium estertheticum]|nr:hypothetical protein [Clostridium estertheticum]MBZ9689345.1 hypothetical protein [Clostridium estertheticum]
MQIILINICIYLLEYLNLTESYGVRLRMAISETFKHFDRKADFEYDIIA